MHRTRVEKLWAEYRYRVERARFDCDTEVKPEEFIELLEALLDEEESPVACGHQCHTADAKRYKDGCGFCGVNHIAALQQSDTLDA